MQTSSSSNSQNSKKAIRRHDIDWLRVILFGLLIPFHVAIGVYWSTYGTDINPNFEELSGEDREEFAENNNDYTAESVTFTSMILHWMHQWRLAALFMISGMGTAFAFKRRTWKVFLTERCKRLLIPMFFGAWTMGFAGSVILGEQEMTLAGLTEGFLIGIIWRSLFFWIPIFGKLLALGHLWFLWNLFQYSVILTPIFYLVRNNPEGELIRFLRAPFRIPMGIGIFILLPLILVLTEIIFKPWFPGFIGVGYEWFWFFVFFAFGYVCITAKDEYYEFIENRRMQISILTMLWTIAFVWLRFEQHDSGIPYVDGGWLENNIFHNGMTILACLIHSFHAWFWCLTIFSWAAHLFNKPSDNLAYLNQGVYPFYIVHMPLTFAGLRISSELGLKNYPAVIIATVFVVLTCWVFFEAVRRTKVSRFLFGIKSVKQ
ncbi:MAG: acyltransferase family protein [Candidatus Thermoplasmatota archaeon]|nr:acyltransferase family protein [Candidatus Thermoplasmatota archaeon]